jgi:Xaa-Pro aminopeptidase
MSISRRDFIGMGAAASGLAALRPSELFAQAAAPELRPMTGDVVPIAGEEYLARIAKAQRLMRAQGLSALLIEPGASLVYFTGVQWWRSERLTAAILPREGEACIVTPQRRLLGIRSNPRHMIASPQHRADGGRFRRMSGHLRDWRPDAWLGRAPVVSRHWGCELGQDARFRGRAVARPSSALYGSAGVR